MIGSINNPPLATQNLPSRRPGVSLLIAGLASIGLAAAMASAMAHQTSDEEKQQQESVKSFNDAPHIHRVGFASFYANKFSGRTMADGTPMRPESDNAASLTLPLGSKALVKNLRNGRTAVVTIRDRGPYIKGRIIDVSPSTARMLGMVHAGVVKVKVTALDNLAPEEKLDAIIAAADSSEANLSP